jgi:uncharacterized protein YndB with AHSA1/START domain
MAESVSASVVINAERATVWRFMSDQARFLAWMTFVPGMPAPAGSAFEPRVGGTLRVIFPNGGAAKGSVVEIEPPRKLVFTWGYEPDVGKTGLRPGSCRVEVVLSETEGGTLVTLTHSGPMSPEIAKGHEAGWAHYLSQLAVQSSREFHQERLADALAPYFGAFSEPDAAKRDALLATCTEEDVRLRTAFACTDGRSALSAHIANGLKHMPGCKLEQAGMVNHIHGVARVPWRVVAGEGKTVFKGENIVRFSARGKIVEVVGFQG